LPPDTCGPRRHDDVFAHGRRHSDVPAIVSVGQKLLEGQLLGGAPGDRAEIYQDAAIGQHRFV